MLADPQALVEDLQSMAGEELRVVATYDREGYDAIYVRPDTAERLADRAVDVHRDLVLQGIGREHLEDLFGAGELRCSMHSFAELSAFHFVADEYRGLFVSVDAGAEVPLGPFVERCKEAL